MKEKIVKKSISMFSADTLDSIAMAHTLGGNSNTYCAGAYCVSGCGSKTGACDITVNVHDIACGAHACSCHKLSELKLAQSPELDLLDRPYNELI